ncbi:MAG: fibronectin type III domain-containing protein [Nitrospirota bacterium]
MDENLTGINRRNLNVLISKMGLLVLSLLVVLPLVSSADLLDNWHWRNPLPQGNPLNGITYGQNTFIAVGDMGTIVSSSDGMNWTIRKSGTRNGLYGVAYGNGTFVAVGEDGIIITSPDGVNWTKRSSVTSNDLKEITYGENIFVAVGDGEIIITSPDGVNWTKRVYLNTWGCFEGVAYGNETFVAVGYDGDDEGVIATSPDGVNWTVQNLGMAVELYGITYGENIFVAVGENGIIITSPDGANWTEQNSGTSWPLTEVAYGNGTFVVVGYEYDGEIITSPDGVNWTKRTSGTSTYLEGITYGNDTFVAVGQRGEIITSPDGTNWTERSSGTHVWFDAITYYNNNFVAVRDEPYHEVILTSSDGVNWTEQLPGTYLPFYGVAYGNNIFVAVEPYGALFTSSDGTIWKKSSGSNLYGVAYGNGTFVAAGWGGEVRTSPDGVHWIVQTLELPPSGFSPWLTGVAYGNGTFVVVGELGTVLTSPDGITWTEQSSLTYGLRGVAYGNNIFVALDGYRVYTSIDGTKWTADYYFGPFRSLQGISYGNNTFVVVGENGTILQSYPYQSINPPSQLRSKTISSTQIVLNWIDNSDNELGFKIERKKGTCNSTNTWKQIAKKGANITTHTNSGLTSNTKYSYRVRAYNADGNSAYSNCASAKTALSGTPKAPTNFRARSVSSTKVNLSWKDNSADETGFKVYRKAGSGSWTLLTTTPANVVSYSDTTATKNVSTTTYSYYIKSCNGTGCSPQTNVAVVPYKPINLTATPVSSSQINLTWTDKSKNETGFEVYRKSGVCSSANPWSKIKTTWSNVSSYSNTGLTSGMTYSYKTRAYKKSSAAPYAYGYSAYSNCKSATTP